jgi:hypothetical protein
MLWWLILCFNKEDSLVFSFFFEAIVGESKFELGLELLSGYADDFFMKAPEVVCIFYELFLLLNLLVSLVFFAK